MNLPLWAAIREYIIAECTLVEQKARPVRLGPGGGWSKQAEQVTRCETEVRRIIDLLADPQPIEPTSHAQGAPGEAVGYAVSLEANMNGFLDVRMDREGEFTIPLYTCAAPGEAVAYMTADGAHVAVAQFRNSAMEYKRHYPIPLYKHRHDKSGVLRAPESTPIEGTAARSGAEPNIECVAQNKYHTDILVDGVLYRIDENGVVEKVQDESPEPQPPANTERPEVSERERVDGGAT